MTAHFPGLVRALNEKWRDYTSIIYKPKNRGKKKNLTSPPFFVFCLRNNSWKPECAGSFNMDWRILVFYLKFTNIRKRSSYPFSIISLAHAPVNMTDFSIGSINCVGHFFRKI
jgi:hypothetical protein